MAQNKILVDIESSDNYENAKKDLIKALFSVNRLSLHQQQKLMEELFGAAKVAVACDMVKRYFE